MHTELISNWPHFFVCQSRIHIFTDSQLDMAGIHSSPKRNVWKCSTQRKTAPPNGILASHTYAKNVPPIQGTRAANKPAHIQAAQKKNNPKPKRKTRLTQH